MAASVSAPEQGQIVSVRSRHWMVTDVSASTLPPSDSMPAWNRRSISVALSSVEDDGLGEELNVIWELEPGARVVERVALPEPTGFDPPDRLDAFLDAVRWGAASTADLRSIQSPFRAGIEHADYQLWCARFRCRGPLIADGVGLGKTIEAGLTVLESSSGIGRGACWSSARPRCRFSGTTRFGLDFLIVDSERMADPRVGT